MMPETSEINAVLSAIDPQETVGLALAMGKINSPPGGEAEIARFVLDWLAEHQIAAYLQEFSSSRPNVIATLAGSEGAQSLILNSHLDTAYGDPMDVWTAGRLNPGDTTAWIDGDKIYGQGVVNDKAPMAATLIALKALKTSGVPMRGDLIFTGVGGEIGRAPIDEYQGPKFEGKGIGTRYAVTHGVVADHALVAECTNWTITEVECGCLFLKITIYGSAVYTPFLSRPEDSTKNPNAIVRAAHLISAFEHWAGDYETRHSYRASSGRVIPKASIGAIRAGLPYKPIETAGVCSLYVDVRLPPGLSPQVPLEELRRLLLDLKLESRIEPFLFRAGYEGRGVETLREAIESSHRHFFSQPTGEPDPPVSSMWRDLNVFNEVGIPAVTYGPPLGLGKEGWTYFMKKEDLIRAARIYALIALDICNRPRA